MWIVDSQTIGFKLCGVCGFSGVGLGNQLIKKNNWNELLE